MPHVVWKLYVGKSEPQKAAMADQITKAVMRTANCREESVSVAIDEVAPSDRADKVYRPDIQNNWDRLYKRPGYNPL